MLPNKNKTADKQPSSVSTSASTLIKTTADEKITDDKEKDIIGENRSKNEDNSTQTSDIVATADAEQIESKTGISMEAEIANEKPVVEVQAKNRSTEKSPVPAVAPVAQSKSQTSAQPTQNTPQQQIIYKIPPNFVQNLLIKARAKIQERKGKKLDKIMTLFEIKSQITNQDVQKLLRTTKRTTTRYFDILENKGKIIQIGKTGRSVLYIKKP